MLPTLLRQHLARYISLDLEEEQFFLSLLQFKTIRKRDYLIKQGEVCKYETFILRGCMRTFTLDDQGNEHVLLLAMEDWWTGDLYSFLTQRPSSYYIEALETCEVAQISKQDLDLLYEQIPKFERFFRILLQNAYIAQQDRIKQNLSMGAEDRYLEFQRRYPQLEQRISQKQIAAYLGVTPVFLSMIRRKWASR